MGLIKQIFSFLLIFIIGSLIVSFLIYPSSFNSFKHNVKSISENVIDNIKSLESNVKQDINLEDDNYCEENIIPGELKILGERITNGIEPNFMGSFDENPKWKDGTDMVVQLNSPFYPSFKYDCRVGNKEGENINYIYCNRLRYFKTIQNISENGEVQGYDEHNYLIKLTVEKDSYKKEQGYRRDFRGKYFEFGYFYYYKIVDYTCAKLS